MYKPVAVLSAEYGFQRNWGYKILREIQACPRYKGKRITMNKGYQTVNTAIFADYLEHRQELRHKNLARRLGAYE